MDKDTHPFTMEDTNTTASGNSQVIHTPADYVEQRVAAFAPSSDEERKSKIVSDFCRIIKGKADAGVVSRLQWYMINGSDAVRMEIYNLMHQINSNPAFADDIEYQQRQMQLLINFDKALNSSRVDDARTAQMSANMINKLVSKGKQRDGSVWGIQPIKIVYPDNLVIESTGKREFVDDSEDKQK